MRLLPGALNVEGVIVELARVNGGSRCDSLNAAKCFIVQLATCRGRMPRSYDGGSGGDGAMMIAGEGEGRVG